jgi:plasmid replication initiation protein
MSEKQLPLPGAIIKKSNLLVRAAWSPESIWETRLIAIVASKIHIEDANFLEYEIPVAEFWQREHGGGKDYSYLMTGIDRLMGRVITIKEETGWTKYNIFSKCVYLKGQGIIRVSFHPDLKSHFLGLKSRFVQYNLFEYLMLPSIYSQQIFELLMSWRTVVAYEIRVEDLHEMLCTPEEYRRDFCSFRRRVLDKAKEDINKKTMLRFEWEPVKKGRKVVAVRFIFDEEARKKRVEKEGFEARRKKGVENNLNFFEALECAEKGVCQKQKTEKCKVCELMDCLAIVVAENYKRKTAGEWKTLREQIE